MIFFTAQNCLHKATHPLRGYRDVVVFLLYPSATRLEKFGLEERERLSRNFGYLLNPFSNKPLRVGDE